MINEFLEYFSYLPKEVVILLLSFLPVSELRGAIPIGLSVYNLGIVKTLILAFIGNFSFVIPFLWFLNNLHHHFMKIKCYNKFFSWWYSRVKPNTKNIEKYEYIGLAIFVSIPFPATGAWSGCLASYILGLDFWKSVIAICVGIIIAGAIVTISTVGITQIFNFISHFTL